MGVYVRLVLKIFCQTFLPAVYFIKPASKNKEIGHSAFLLISAIIGKWSLSFFGILVNWLTVYDLLKKILSILSVGAMLLNVLPSPEPFSTKAFCNPLPILL